MSSRSENVCFLISSVRRFVIQLRGGEIDRLRIALHLMWLVSIMSDKSLAFVGYLFVTRIVFCRKAGPSAGSIRNWLIRVYQ